MSARGGVLNVKCMTTLVKTRTATRWIEAPPGIRTVGPIKRRTKVIILCFTLVLLAAIWAAVAILILSTPATTGVQPTITPTGTTIPAHRVIQDANQRLPLPEPSSGEEGTQ